jgi:hypothetical protein
VERLARTILVTIAAFLVLQGLAAMAAQPAMNNDGGRQAASVSLDRPALVREILSLWEGAPNPVNTQNEALHGDLRAALAAATPEQLLDAKKARTLDDLWAALPNGAQSQTKIVPLAAGQRIPQVLASLGQNLVYTPVTPCRIIDTRGGIAPYTGVIGPNLGNWFYVTGSTYANQGGFAGSCGIPSSPKPAAVAINITSTGQAGSGNLRAIQTGGGTPNVSLVNYVAGINIANAAIVTSYPGAGEEIYIYSANSTSHAVVDIMGYFSTAPTAGRAYAAVLRGSPPTFNSTKTKGFSAVTQPSTGVYCLTPSDSSVDPTTVPWFVTIDWDLSGGSDLMAFISSSGLGFCSAGQFTVLTYTFGANPSVPVLSNNVAFEVFVP